MENNVQTWCKICAENWRKPAVSHMLDNGKLPTTNKKLSVQCILALRTGMNTCQWQTTFCTDLHQDLQAGRVERPLQILCNDVWVVGINLCKKDQHTDVCITNIADVKLRHNLMCKTYTRPCDASTYHSGRDTRLLSNAKACWCKLQMT